MAKTSRSRRAPVSTPTPTLNREGWLVRMVEELRPIFEGAGYPLPARVAVSVGFPSKGALASKRRRIGECWRPETTAAKVPTILISPLLDEVGAAGTLAHELAHAATPGAGHKGAFVKCCKAVGLTEGKPTVVGPGEELQGVIDALREAIGPYAHDVLKLIPSDVRTKKQSTRMLKAECQDCGYKVRVTRKWLDEAGPPLCPCNREAMEPEVKEDGVDKGVDVGGNTWYGLAS